MSETAVLEIIDRAIADKDFRALLFTNPSVALEGYDLTAEEIEMLSNLNADNFDEFVGGLGDRTTKGFVPGTG